MAITDEIAPAPPPGDPPEPAQPPSEYASLVEPMNRMVALDPADPLRRELRDEIVVSLLPLVRHLAQRHASGHPAGVEELVQVGSVGLLGAVDRWDPDRAGGDLLGYLVPCIRGEMLRWFRDRTWATRVPRRLKDLSVAINKATGPLSQKLGRSPRPSELAAHLGVDVGEVVEALTAKAGHHADALDPVDPDTGTGVGQRLGDVDAELDHVENRHALRPLLDSLPERERTILVLRFFKDMTQTQIAEEVGISQMHVSRLLTRTLATLRKGLSDND
ncbi:MAG: sigma-70 family RNA polymerase sigma factor [Pseudonocardia sp.]|uniref:sigma-70 family RNA polymerase sigma factor n=1 Tax=unclassified Pseudonocardia TaxID=2619320 RepID=UPI000B190992|nr:MULTISPECIES: sigma-70 family RNA polymerase sigma factor [unclassified Pseudonocardia]MBN9107490.1 sigma-70 family RNA polymerase sigma factor [Pseudonocardia sp.]